MSASPSGPPGPVPAASPFPFEDKSKRECRFECLYQRANENLSLQSLYLIKKSQKLEAYAQASPTDTDGLADELYEFCTATDPNALTGGAFQYVAPSSSGGTSGGATRNDQAQVQACYDRYKTSQAVMLSRIRDAIRKNNTVVDAIRSGPAPGVEPAPPIAVIDQDPTRPGGPPPPQKAQIPYLPTFQELKDEFLRTAGGGLQGQTPWDDARASLHQPQPDEFVKFREIPRDPRDPQGPKMSVAVTRPDGSLVIDQQAYQKALAEYQGKPLAGLNRAKLTDLDLAIRRTAPARARDKAIARQNAGPRPQPLNVSDLSEKAYKEARGIIFKKVDDVLKGNQASGSKPGRAPAAGAGSGATGQGSGAATSPGGKLGLSQADLAQSSGSGASALPGQSSSREPDLKDPRPAGTASEDISVQLDEKVIKDELQGLDREISGIFDTPPQP